MPERSNSARGGKTILISIANASAGLVAGHGIVRDYQAARKLLGLVPVERGG